MNIFGLEIKLPWSFRRNRRKAPRARTFEDLYVDYRSLDHSLRGMGEGRDVSMNGIQFFSDRRIPQGMRVELSVRIAPGVLDVRQIQVRGQVVRCSKGFREKQYRVACVFEGIDEGTRGRLEIFVAWLKERERHYLFFRYHSPE